MKKIILLSLLVGTFNTVLVGQVKTDIFDQLQENVWYLPTSDASTLLYITSIGTGDTIVTLHGGPGNDFNYLVDALKENSENNTFILFDQRGSLLSPVADSLIANLTLDVIVEDLETLRKSLNQDKMLLFGHSFGSLVAMFYYMKYPEHVKGIILSATMPPYINDDKPFNEILKEIHKRCLDLRNRPEITTELVKADLMNDSILTPRQRSDKFKILGLASFNMINIANWKKFQGGRIYYNPLVDNAIGESIPNTYDIRPSLNKYSIPITIIQGEKDYIDPSAYYWTSIFFDYEFVKLIVVKNASHYIWLDDKLKFDESLRYAIDRIKN
ncbi:MAG: alpha/beta fold hydrolase [Paludibacter sp.]